MSSSSSSSNSSSSNNSDNGYYNVDVSDCDNNGPAKIIIFAVADDKYFALS